MTEGDKSGEAELNEKSHSGGSFIRTYIFSTDHKMVGKQFLVLAVFMLAIGGMLAMGIRWQLAFPEQPLPVIGASESYIEEGEPEGLVDELWQKWEEEEEPGWLMENIPYGVIVPEFYNSVITMHATIMVFFFVMPVLVGTFANFLIPLMIGARDMAFPKLNMLSFWFAVLSALIMLSSFFVPGGAAASGWTAYPPLSAVVDYTGVNWGQNLWILSLGVFSFSSMMGSVNYITTVVNMRAKGLTFFRLPLVIWFIWITAIIALLALPVLLAAAVLLLFDRLFGTSFYLAAGGGDPILWQHLFWFFGHPEVYILFLPALGICLEILPVFARKPFFGYRSTVYALISASVLSFIVWGHHMFVSGMDPTALASFFSLFTVIISAPFALMLLNAIASLWGGNIRFAAPMHYVLGLIAIFIVGGLGGIFLGTAAVDIPLHDTYFVVGHFHFIIFGSIFMGIFAAIHYWYPKMFGRMMSEALGKVHFWLTAVFFLGTFFPMHLLGIGGHMRRIYNPLQYEYLQDMQWMNVFITVSAFMLGASQLIWLYNIIRSYFRGEKAAVNPWNANTIEWTAESPPPHGNFATAPVVNRGPYEYSVPGLEEDWLPQTAPPLTKRGDDSD